MWKNSPNSSRLIQRVFLCHGQPTDLSIWANSMAKHGETWTLNEDCSPPKKIPWQWTIHHCKRCISYWKMGDFPMSSWCSGAYHVPQKGPFKKESSLKTTTFSGDMFGFQFSMGVFFQMKTIEHENCEQKSAVGPSANWGLVKTCLHMG